MNREIKITLVVLVVLVGVIVILEMSQGEDVLPKVEPIQELEVVQTTPQLVKVPDPQPSSNVGQGFSSGPFGNSSNSSIFSSSDNSGWDQGEIEQSQKPTPVVGSKGPGEKAPGETRKNDTKTRKNEAAVKAAVEKETVGLSDPAKVEPVRANAKIPQNYRIMKGDTISRIAEKVLGSVHFVPALLEANPELQPNQLIIGVELEMPSAASLEARATRLNAKNDKERGSGFYRIKAGDSLFKISREIFGSTKKVPEILQLNPNIDPRQLKVGQTIKLPPKN